MKALLVLSKLQIENANAISGFTWGFPAMSNFLGFTHSLSRRLQEYASVSLEGCAVICHSHSVQAYQPSGWGDHVFALTRNPLTKTGTTAPFVEEGRMQMEVTILIECNFTAADLDFGGISDDEDIAHLEKWLKSQVPLQKIAGGNIIAFDSLVFKKLPQQQEERWKFERQTLLRLLPGFALVDRNDLFTSHHERRKEAQPESSPIDSWLDFFTIRHIASMPETSNETGQKITEWEQLPNPAQGWLVPISNGYKAISRLYDPSEVQRARDMETPFRFVESVYSIGEWISPHRVKNLASLFWRYHQEEDCYLCRNEFSKEVALKQSGE